MLLQFGLLWYFEPLWGIQTIMPEGASVGTGCVPEGSESQPPPVPSPPEPEGPCTSACPLPDAVGVVVTAAGVCSGNGSGVLVGSGVCVGAGVGVGVGAGVCVGTGV